MDGIFFPGLRDRGPLQRPPRVLPAVQAPPAPLAGVRPRPGGGPGPGGLRHGGAPVRDNEEGEDGGGDE